MYCSDQTFGAQHGPELFGFAQADLVHLHAEAPGHGYRVSKLVHAALSTGYAYASGLSKTGVQSGLMLELLVELNSIASDIRQRAGRTQLGYHSRRVSGGPAADGASFQYHHVLPTHFGKVIGGAAPYDASPNDYDLCVLWKLLGHDLAA